MKYLIILSCLLFTFVGWSKTINSDDLIISNQDGLFYEKFTDVPFTGNVTGERQGKISKGKREGEWLFYYESGQLERKVNYKDGKREGERLNYWDNGQLRSKSNFKDGRKEGERLIYHKNGQLIKKSIYKDGELIKTIKP